MHYTIREMRQSEYPLLDDFLYESIYVPEGVAPPPKSIISKPELQLYTAGFGKSEADCALAAEVDGRVVGAVWARIMNDYGHIDGETPSLAISLYREYRGRGIGTAMLEAMLALLRERGYRRASLSVQKANYAVKIYRRAGFQVIVERGGEYIMSCGLL